MLDTDTFETIEQLAEAMFPHFTERQQKERVQRLLELLAKNIIRDAIKP